ncbi:MAG TPA: hypothetical protein VE987_21060 [Polyangiaceae bacterium]|nr:hypothetical protein [Polyangiaceae bacterium]
MTVRRVELGGLAVIALVFGAAPTVGDIGSCGRVATDLDQRTFALARKALDCRRCTECGVQTQTCQRACDPAAPADVGWPSTCRPLEHDGEVCLRALQAASCSDYAAYVADADRTVPTECDFCRLLPGAGDAAAPGE